MVGVMWWALAEVEGPCLVTASWLNRRVMNGPGAWLWNGLQMPGILLQACQNTQRICCIGKRERTNSCRWKKRAEAWSFCLKSPQLDTALTFVTAWPSVLIKNPSQSTLKITFASPVCMFLHRSASQSNLPGYHNSHSVPRPQTPHAPSH